MSHFDVVLVGAGFAGSILARILRRQGLRVVLFDRQHHPRFALGESTTPLANFALERLARRYDLPDLWRLATHERWQTHHPGLRCGLKRGFTFFAHRPGQPYANGATNDARLMVAASPNDRVADTHWLRSDVDHHFLERARDEGVTVYDGVAVERVEARPHHFGVHAVIGGQPRRFTSRWLVDGSGPRGVLARAMGLASHPGEQILGGLATSLIYNHFEGLGSFVEAARSTGAVLEPGPYPDERAAVHHLLAEGWLYVLPFDHGVASAGVILRHDLAPDLVALARRDPAAAWGQLLDRYPTLASTFAEARPLRPFSTLEPVPYRLDPPTLPGALLLPHSCAFFDPLFSTGIAWSLLVVERLADLVTETRGDATRHHRLLRAEIDQVEHLVEAGLRSMADFELFAAVARLYFATVSFAEAGQRLGNPDPALSHPAWEGFLGAGNGRARSVFRHTAEALRDMMSRECGGIEMSPGEDPPDPTVESSVRAVSMARVDRYLASYDVIGLDQPESQNLVPVDLDVLVHRAHLLGLSHSEMEAALPRLRGESPDPWDGSRS